MQWRKRVSVLAALLLFLQGVLFPAVLVWAAAGTVYSCIINRCYAHPVTGAIEDPGGQASYATGQGMLEGAISNFGIMEVTEGGAYYLTFRIGLVDFSSGQSFSVQNVGDSGWSAVTPTVTANGSDSNGTTSDLCIQVPSENCIVRCSMYVTPMGRDVVFYFYPNNYTEGNTTGMTAAMVAESADSGSDTAQTDTADTAQTDSADTAQTNTDETAQTDTETMAQTDSGTADLNAAGKTAQASESVITESALTSSIEQAAAPTADTASDAALSSAQGLSLSTAAEAEAEPENRAENSSIPIVELIVAVAISMTISGLILILAAAGIVYYFRKNWRRWGGYDNEEYENEDA